MLLLHLAIIIILAKLVSGLCVKYRQPPVLGMLVCGLILGPTGFKLIEADIVLHSLAEIGVIILLFMAGLETNIREMRSTGKIAFSVALGGAILPFILGIPLSLAFKYNWAQSIVIATILTATSVSVTVMTLLDLNKLKKKEGTVILSAAILDDVMGVIILTLVIGIAGGKVNIGASLLKMSIFLVGASIVGLFGFRKIMYFTRKLKASEAIIAVALGIAFVYSGLAKISGVASITGAYLAGLFLGRTAEKTRLINGMDKIGQSLFISVFFIVIGLEAQVGSIHRGYIFLLFFILAAISGKIVGCLLGAKIGGLNNKQALMIGIGMIPRGEVALVVGSIGLSAGLIGQREFSFTVLMVIITALITPSLLKLVETKLHE